MHIAEEYSPIESLSIFQFPARRITDLTAGNASRCLLPPKLFNRRRGGQSGAG